MEPWRFLRAALASQAEPSHPLRPPLALARLALPRASRGPHGSGEAYPSRHGLQPPEPRSCRVSRTHGLLSKGSKKNSVSRGEIAQICSAALPGQVHKKPAKICPGACVFPLLCIVLSPTILDPEKTRFHRPENGRVPTRFCLHHGPFQTRSRRPRNPIYP